MPLGISAVTHFPATVASNLTHWLSADGDVQASPERGGAERSEAERLIGDFVGRTPQSSSMTAPLLGEPTRLIIGCPSVIFDDSSPFWGAFLMADLLGVGNAKAPRRMVFPTRSLLFLFISFYFICYRLLRFLMGAPILAALGAAGLFFLFRLSRPL